jgi:uncharacterized ion transporter superfamily protein YfcC
MWLGAIKLALNAGTHIYKKKKETQMLMADAQAQHASKMARGELEFSGKLLEARQNDYKDEVVLAILTLPIIVLAYGVWSDDPQAMDKIKIFFEHFQALPKWFTNLWVLVCASIFGIKGTQIFRNNGVKK